MKQHVFVAPTLAFLLAASVGHVPRDAAQAPLRPAPAQAEALVKQALEDRLAALDLPDENLLGDETTILVREEMPKAGMKLGKAALPQRAGTTFYLTSQAAVQSEADRMGRSLFFVTADRPSISGDTATLWLGVGVVVPRDSKRGVLCCCSGLGQFHRVGDRWTFARWMKLICA